MSYEITGVDRSGKRFKITTTNRIQALGINLYRGSVWVRNSNQTRTRIKSICN